MSAPRKNPLLLLLDGSFVLGAACTAVFYVIMLSPGMQGSIWQKYTTEHYVEYVVVALSFWGLVDVLRKLAGFPRDMLALRQPWMPERTGREPISRAGDYLQELAAKPAWLRKSRVGRRLDRALRHLVDTGSAADLRDHLQILSDQDAERSHNNYTLVRFVVRVTPVLGFLGTVVHFGTALNGISFDKMTDHLSVVVSEMGQAFNTTTAALASAMFMMFAQFVCEWLEQSVVKGADRAVERWLLNRFEVKDANILPFLSVLKSANDEAMQMVAGNLDRQIASWEHALGALFQRFDERQQRESAAWTEALDALASRHEEYDALREQRLRQLLDVIDERQDKFMHHVHGTLEKAATLRDGFGDFMDALHAIARGEGKLAELQETLTDNLQAIHGAQQLDEAIHGLAGAIHLLTARHHGGGPAKAA